MIARFFYRVLLLIAGLIVVVGFGYYHATVAQLEGEIKLSGLKQTVTVEFDRYANPVIFAADRIDAYFALGYLTAQERMFQMDLMRRKSAGRLAEIFGAPALRSDIHNRHYRFADLAQRLVSNMAGDQRRVLEAYTEGVNSYLSQQKILPVEFQVLDYQPENWRPEDSLLVSLGMFQLLNENEDDERMLTVMKAALPADVNAFLAPKNGMFSDAALLEGKRSFDNTRSAIPVQSLKSLVADNNNTQPTSMVDHNVILAGSNQWATNKTRDGSAILANDMHLPLSVPGIWYRAALRYPGGKLDGITLPGLPLIVVGSNGAIAWGFTNAMADVLDLVALDINPVDAEQYRGSQGWQQFIKTEQIIRVKDQPDHKIMLRQSEWGPVSPRKLMGKPVAIRWSIYDPGAVNLKMLDLDRTRELSKALDLFNQSGIPVLNVMFADKQGNIAWTLAGRLPERVGFDGSSSQSWIQKELTWQGFMKPEQIPRKVNPESGYLMTANNRVLAESEQFEYGQNFANGYRAYHIGNLLNKTGSFTVKDMHDLQLDTRSKFYDLYRETALAVLTEPVIKSRPLLGDAKRAIEDWDGHAQANSVGFGLLVAYRRKLADSLFTVFLKNCRIRDQRFHYKWYQMDTPVRLLISHKIPETLPKRYQSWDDLLLKALLAAINEIKRDFPEQQLATLTWGDIAMTELKHPFALASPMAGRLLNMPVNSQPGCSYCVRVANGSFSASMRLVVTPGQEDDMILVEPTGQSGNPLSPHYNDKFDDWINGRIPEHTEVTNRRVLQLMPG